MANVRKLHNHESDLIGRIIADGFADDAVNLWAFNGGGAMQPAFTTMAKHLFLPKGFGHCTEDGLAGTLWLPPGTTKTYGTGNLSLVYSILRYGGLTGIRHSLAIDCFMTTNRKGRPPHYYLFAIAVTPRLQGKGIGGVLMREALREVDRSGLPAYLENSKRENIAFYQNHGFEVEREVTPAPGCPPMWLMWRPARGSEPASV
ncbi:GNAT family N-acetyltransferase [Kordiimonas aestuarii]|uniref:GNAT family N-acetyltransferase n=1 Tax=Kordiimonas aestuarii TaxID=1005925 RepID=UPI0021D157BF|nr:GNAT family N-acetyltransferase [Kordiimonas aestuarii]